MTESGMETTKQMLVAGEREHGKEAWGWISLAVLMALFPLLFFLCVYFPIWLGVMS